jgi:hypothetical protein
MMDYVAWQNMNWTVMVHDQLGLIGIVATSLPTLPPGPCKRVFDALVRGMNDEMGVRPTGAVTVPQGQNVCEAVPAGRGQAGHHWRAAGDGPGVSVWVEPRDGLVHYVIGTSAFRQWAGQGRDPLAYAAGVTPAAGAQASASQPAPRPSQPAPDNAGAPQAPANARGLGITADAFRAIRPGMSYRDVVAVIGREGQRAQQVQGVPSETYTWQQQGDFKTIGVTFMEGRAILSIEAGLYPMTHGAPITLAQYEGVREGMTLEAVNTLLGGPGVYTGFIDVMGTVTHGYRWRGRQMGSVASVTFLNGRATSVRVQVGLQ